MDALSAPLILSAVQEFPPALRGGVAVIVARSHRAFRWVMASPATTASDLARLLALALLDRGVGLLEPTLMPARQPLALLRDDGKIRHRLFRSLPPWAEAEQHRLANRLTGFSGAVLDALRAGRPQDPLGLPPRDFPIRDETGRTYSLKPPDVAVDVDTFRATIGRRKHHEHVRIEYQRDRYLRHLDENRLHARANAIMRNIHQIDAEGRITLEPTEVTGYWMDRLTELAHELALRGETPHFIARALHDGIPLPTEKHASDFREYGRAIARVAVPETPYLVKYGKAAHMRAAIEKGRVRLGAASDYADPSLDAARHDHELAHEIDIDLSSFPWLRDDISSFRAGPSGRAVVRSEFPTNFLVFCASARLRARLFADFEADACLIIHDPDAFRRRLHSWAASQLPEWRPKAQRVTYYDPQWVGPGEVNLPFWKSFAYAYQEEVRFVLIPSQPVGTVQSVFAELGSLEELAKLVVL